MWKKRRLSSSSVGTTDQSIPSSATKNAVSLAGTREKIDGALSIIRRSFPSGRSRTTSKGNSMDMIDESVSFCANRQKVPESHSNASPFSPSIATSVNSPSCLSRTCLSPRYSLRYQLFLSFGILSCVLISLVMITGILTAQQAGMNVKSLSRSNFEDWAQQKLLLSSRYLAETLTKKLQNFEGMVRIMKETTRERFVGYPYHEGFVDDKHVPFWDMDAQRNIYPLKAEKRLPLDWQITPHITRDNQKEHVQQRFEWYAGAPISTQTPSYFFPGICDPSETSPTARTYYRNCTDSNNVQGSRPTVTNDWIWSKVSDYAGPVLKPLYEYHTDVKHLSILFANEGAGSIVSFPAFALPRNLTYVSRGCDWMLKPHPFLEGRTIGNAEQIANCAPSGTRKNVRDYNTLESTFCAAQALNPHKVLVFGPSLDPFAKGLWLLRIGISIYDRLTHEFIGCTSGMINIELFSRIVGNANVTEASDIALLRWDNQGTVVASPKWDSSSSTSAPTVEELGIGINTDLYKDLQKQFYDSWELFSDLPRFHSLNPKCKNGPTLDAFASNRAGDGVFTVAYPVPTPPDEYDPMYEPEFMVVMVVREDEWLSDVDDLDRDVTDAVCNLIERVLITGCCGLVAVTFLICVMSLFLTKPLEWMNKVGDRIVSSYGSSIHDIENTIPTVFFRFAPKTEITSLVKEFQKMVTRFSGKGTAKLYRQRGHEVKNPFHLSRNFQSLYHQRRAPSFRYGYEFPSPQLSRLLPLRKSFEGPPGSSREFRDELNSDPKVQFSERTRLNWGPNQHIRDEDAGTRRSLRKDMAEAVANKKLYRSPLFWWIFGAIMVPSLTTVSVICGITALNIVTHFPDLLTSVEEVYVELEQRSLKPIVQLRADFAQEVIAQAVRDLHLLTRVSGWLFFDALSRSDSFTRVNRAAEECKTFPTDGCPYWKDITKASCDCKWDDPWGIPCHDYGKHNDTRYYQNIYYEAQNQDVVWPNGDRNSTTYPDVAETPGTTGWWTDVNDLPGAEVGRDARGYNTTYDRLRVLSSTTMIQIPLYNYAVSSKLNQPFGTYIGLEKGGFFGGYAGCFHYYSEYSYFRSQSKENGGNAAAFLAEHLCPLGKYGFDPRCRNWYVQGREKAKQSGEHLHVTPPYLYAGVNKIGTSAGLPLIDPRTGEFIGETLVDFTTEPIIRSLTNLTPLIDENGFPVLITRSRDVLETDTIVGPNFAFGGFSEGVSTSSIEELVLPLDNHQEPNRLAFREILRRMQGGMTSRDNESFNRTTPDGQELVHFAFAPVKVQSFKPVDSSDFSRGLEQYESLVFSLGLAETNEGLHASFDRIASDLRYTVSVAIAIVFAFMSLAVLALIAITSRVAFSIISPVVQLQHLVSNINKCNILEDIPEIKGGSAEVRKVLDTFERLYMVIRFANTAFFSGDIRKAYETLNDALALFKSLKNEKAIGVANNNLGNCMTAMYRTMKHTGAPTICGMTKNRIIEKGLGYFNKSIDAGEAALSKINEEEGWSTNYLIFMQQLSNRYFNRAMFLLQSRNDNTDPYEAETRGFSDLATTKDMDREVVDNGDRQGFKGDLGVYFDLLLCRIKGILQLLDQGYDDQWGMDELFDDAFQELCEALKDPGHILFREMEPPGQMQRLDAALCSYYRVQKEPVKAAEVAIRMMVEDDYIFCEAATIGVKALIDYLETAKASDLGDEDPSDVRVKVFQYRRAIAGMLAMNHYGRDIVGRESFRQSNVGDFSMEIF